MERRGGWREGGRCETREHGEEKQFKATRHTEGKVETAQVRLSPRPLSRPGSDPTLSGRCGTHPAGPAPLALGEQQRGALQDRPGGSPVLSATHHGGKRAQQRPSLLSGKLKRSQIFQLFPHFSCGFSTIWTHEINKTIHKTPNGKRGSTHLTFLPCSVIFVTFRTPHLSDGCGRGKKKSIRRRRGEAQQSGSWVSATGEPPPPPAPPAQSLQQNQCSRATKKSGCTHKRGHTGARWEEE